MHADGLSVFTTGQTAFGAHHNVSIGDTLAGVSQAFYGNDAEVDLLAHVNRLAPDVVFERNQRIVLTRRRFTLTFDPAKAMEHLDAALDCREQFGTRPIMLNLRWDLVRYHSVDPKVQPTASRIVIAPEAKDGPSLVATFARDTLYTDIFFDKAVPLDVRCVDKE
ncbi:MAG: hypothetical protein AAGL24_06475 [Pseudomonadota bacterium]